MRAAQTTLRRPALLLPRRAERPRRECAETAHSGAVWLFGTMFLAGYLPGTTSRMSCISLLTL